MTGLQANLLNGAHAPYLWGALLAVAAWLVAEPWLLARRHHRACEQALYPNPGHEGPAPEPTP